MTPCPECRLAQDERAAILEYDVGLWRRDAERKAAEIRCNAHPNHQQSPLWRPIEAR